MKKLLIILGIVLILPSLSLAAISLDATSTSPVGGGSPNFWNHTVGVGASILVVQGNPSTVPVTSITYNSSTMTIISNSGDSRNIQAYIVNPTSGTHEIRITLSGSDNFGFDAESFFGTATTSPIGATGTTGFVNPSQSSSTITLTTVSNNSWVVDMIICNSGTHNEGTPSGTLLNEYGFGSSQADSYTTTAIAGNYTTKWSSIGACNQTEQSAFELKAAPSTPVVAAPRRNPIITIVE